MAEVRAPLHISSRLVAALHIPNVGTLHLRAEGREAENRVQYHYIVEDTNHQVIHEGHDLCSGVGFDVDYTSTMESLLAFLEHYGEEYQHDMDGTDFEEWCYLNSDELSMARFDLQEDSA